jgi:uncharacterized protein DUF6090
MLNFLRKLRRNEMKSSRYFKYAIGEILLVVIGILLAVQINQWSQNKKDHKQELLLLSQIHDEFLKNKDQLDLVVSKHQAAMTATEELMSLFPLDLNKIGHEQLNSLFMQMLFSYTFNPSEGSINALINTSSFDLISNDTLRLRLTQWTDMSLDYREDEILAKTYAREFMIPFIVKNFIYNDGVKFIDNPQTKKALKSQELENIIGFRKLTLEQIVKNAELELENLQAALKDILDLSKPKN